MEKPRNTIYGIRILYVSAIGLAVALLFLVYDEIRKDFTVELGIAFLIPFAGWFYLIHLLSKGRFWVRSVFLALTIISALKGLMGLSGPSGSWGILLWLLNVLALYFLYRKDSSAWFANKLMEENLKRIEKQQRKGNS